MFTAKAAQKMLWECLLYEETRWMLVRMPGKNLFTD